jgi:FkbM family methyltransferase
MQALLQEGDLVVDVGANIGMTVLAAALRVGPTGHVTAIEPASRVSGLLRRSLALNGLSERVTLHACAAGEATGSARLHLTAITGHSSLLNLPNAAGTEEVEVRTVDDLVRPGRPVRLAKLDAEGFELQVWRGMRRVVEESPELAVLVEFGPTHLRRAGISAEAWLAEFLSPGFTAYEIDEATGQLKLLRPMTELNAVFSLNLLLLRQPPASFPQLSFA